MNVKPTSSIKLLNSIVTMYYKNMIENYSKKIQTMLKKKGIKIGDKIAIIKGKNRYDGILMPRIETGDPDCLVLKLSNGYNIGIRFENIRVKKLKQARTKSTRKHKRKLKPDPSKPTITVLHTGGTVASKIDYRTGGVTPLITPEELIEAIPELAEIANINVRVVFQMFSEDMEPGHWIILAKKIAEEIQHIAPDGIIITHGTDTMHYTSSALSFMLQQLPIPVLLVGSQRSSDRGSSDAAMNLICAARFIVKSDFSGIAICMHGSMSDDFCLILPGTRTRKMHTSRRDAFQPIDVLPFAKVFYHPERIEFLRNDYQKRDKTRHVLLDGVFDKKVAIVKIRPGFSYKELELYQKLKYRGIVLEGTGLGHAPIVASDDLTKEHTRLIETIKRMSNKAIIVMASQCPYGRVNMNVYSTGRDLIRAGVLSCQMTSETAYVKLGWSLGHTRNIEKAKQLFLKNIAGEVAERTDPRCSYLEGE